MKSRYWVVGAVLILILAAGGIAAALSADDGDPSNENDTSASTVAQSDRFVGLTVDEAIALAQADGRDWRIARQDDESFFLTDDLVAGRVTFEVDDGVVTAATVENPEAFTPGNPPDDDSNPGESSSLFVQDGRFVGLSEDEAAELAEKEGRDWRVARRDGEGFALTDDLVAGRVTFEVDAGVVTAATVENPDAFTPGDVTTEEPTETDLIASALRRLLTADNSFGGEDVFDDIRIARLIASDPDRPLPELELIAEELADLGSIRFIDDADADIRSLFEQSPAGVAVVSVDGVTIVDDRAEIELRLWCGSLCGVFLTYEAEIDGSSWDILGPVGPIAIS